LRGNGVGLGFGVHRGGVAHGISGWVWFLSSSSKAESRQKKGHRFAIFSTRRLPAPGRVPFLLSRTTKFFTLRAATNHVLRTRATGTGPDRAAQQPGGTAFPALRRAAIARRREDGARGPG